MLKFHERRLMKYFWSTIKPKLEVLSGVSPRSYMRSDFLPVVWRVFKDRWVQLLVYSIVSFLLVWMYIGLFPAIRDQADQMKGLLEAYPESLTKAFNIDGSLFTQIEGFEVTDIEDYEDQIGAGNTRPDNVMFVEEPVTFL